MDSIMLAYSLSLAPGLTYVITRPFPQRYANLSRVDWLKFGNNSGATFAAWFHGNTPTPSENAIGNQVITGRTTFLFDIKSGEPEVLARCQQVQTGLNNLSIAVTVPAAMQNQYVTLAYILEA